MPALASVLLTYLLHSSLLLGLAGLLRVTLRERQLGLQEAALRAALLGGFLTAGLTSGLGLVPLLGYIPLSAPSPAPVAAPAATLDLAPVGALPPAIAPGADVDELALAAPAPRPAREWPWREALALSWGALALVGLVRLVSAGLRLRRLLRDRIELPDERLADGARAAGQALGLAAPPRLSLAPGLAAPVATGLWRPEVCLPPRALAELGPDETLALCAHELAHVARRDPAWLLLAHLAEALAPLQPLNRWARRRLQDLAECLSDDLAVAATRRAHGLARSLVDVAAWSLPDDRWEPAAAVGALSVRSRLGHRVERLMDPWRTLELPRRFAFPAALVLALAASFVAPAFSSGQQPGPSPAPSEEGLLPEDELPPPVAPLPPAAPAARPAPAPRPAPAARPAPMTPPAPPAPAAVPAPPAPPAPLAERDLERLAEQMARRAQGHEADLAGLEKEIEALVSRLRPHEAEIERLAGELAENGEGPRAEELRRELERHTRDLRLPEAEMKALQDKARRMAEAARPSESELRELRELSRQVSRDASRQARDAARQTRDQAHQAAAEARTAARLTRDDAREEMRQLAEELRRVGEELRRAAEELRRTAREAAGGVQ